MITKRFSGYKDKTGHPIDEGAKVRIVLGREWTGEEFNQVFSPGQHMILASVAEYCEVI